VQDLVEESVVDAAAELTRSEVSLDAAEAPSLTSTPVDVEVQSLRVAIEASSRTPPGVTIEPDVQAEPEPERLAGWEVQRAHAERLLEAGDRGAGVQALEQVAVDLERIGDLERALTIVDELIRLTPDSIRHHQKRVELAFRSNDRAKLIDAYIELGDVLFRSGEERKARAVYQRVLELAPDDPRARAAVESVASMSPPSGSGAIVAIGSTPADARLANPLARPHPRDGHVPYQPGPGAGMRQAGGIAPPPTTRKPSPLDRSAASNGEFVDLGEWLRSGESPKSTRMVAEEKPPTGDEQADFQEMLKRFKQGVAENVDEEDYESHYDLGVAYKEMGLMDEAVAEFQKALRGTANRVRAYEALGQCFVEKEQYQVAASVLSRAIALGEGDDHHLVGVLYLLGRATEALSNHGDALDYYQRVFAVDIEFRDVAERISAIEGKAT
jgi:tetratricopeptide (TPR) repeat protein